jgi:hypothetical protein
MGPDLPRTHSQVPLCTDHQYSGCESWVPSLCESGICVLLKVFAPLGPGKSRPGARSPPSVSSETGLIPVAALSLGEEKSELGSL